MITNSTDQALDRAFELIEANKLDEARAALKPVLEADRDNPDAWWLYAHAVTDVETARLALSNVLRLDSQYPDAAELLGKIQRHPAIQPLSVQRDFDLEPSFLPPSPSTLPGLDDHEEPDFDDSNGGRPRSSRNVAILALIAAVIVIALIIVVVRPFATNAPTATSVGNVPTTVSDGSNTTTQIPTGDSQTAPSGDFEALRPALTAFTVPDNGINVKSTNLGNTLIVDVCTKAGREMRTALPTVMSTLAGQNSVYSGQVDAVGVQLLDCDSNTPLLVIGVPAADAAAFSANSMTEADFQAKWKPIT